MTPFPAKIAGARIIKARRFPSRRSELSELAVILAQEEHRPEDRQFVVWYAGVRNGLWTAFEGAYDLSREDADREFTVRLDSRT